MSTQAPFLQLRGRSKSDSSAPSRQQACNHLGSVDGLDKYSVTSSEGLPVSGTPPLKRKSKLASISKIFKPWKWRKKKTSEKFQEASALLERKMSTRQSREELIRRGVLKDIPEQDGNAEVTFRNGHTIHAVPIRVEPTAESTTGSVSSNPATRPPETDKSCHSVLVSNSLPPSQSPSQPHSAMNTNHPQDLPGFSGTGDMLRKSGKHSDFPSQPPSLQPSQSDSFGPPIVTHPLPQLGNHDVKPKAEVEKSEMVVDQSDPDQQQNLEMEAPLADSSQPNVADGEMEVSQEQTETDLTVTGETQKGSSDEVDSCEKSETTVSLHSKKSHVQLDNSTPVIVIPSAAYPDSLGSDSDSDSSLQDKNEDDEDDEDEECLNSALANKIRRRDTLAIKLRNRPTKQELEEKNILPRKSDEERMELRQQIGTKLIRRLSQRPSLEELEQRNILRYRNEEEEHEERLEIRRRLTRKLSLRPTVAELQARRILRFNEYVEVTEAQDYDRRADKPWTRLTPADKAAIRKELNEFKSREMEVHEESRHLTRFHRP
ncbi:phosphatase and actin regulator 2 isoform X3 [Heterodontus francisci]|uniref:phosphatase and actin regulator 2 isoform X3 n=1 Tax=Heterodontus francisci TaxID=7792 RepID=UPI00355C6C17